MDIESISRALVRMGRSIPQDSNSFKMYLKKVSWKTPNSTGNGKMMWIDPRISVSFRCPGIYVTSMMLFLVITLACLIPCLLFSYLIVFFSLSTVVKNFFLVSTPGDCMPTSSSLRQAQQNFAWGDDSIVGLSEKYVFHLVFLSIAAVPTSLPYYGHIYMHTHTHTHARTHARTHTHTHTHTHTRTHTHAHAHAHTHAHTHTSSLTFYFTGLTLHICTRGHTRTRTCFVLAFFSLRHLQGHLHFSLFNLTFFVLAGGEDDANIDRSEVRIL